MAATNYLDITPAVRQQIGLRSLKDFMASVTIPIAMLHGDALKPSWRATDCDLSATHPYDPYRVASGKGFDDIDAPKAVQACDLELKSHPNEMRYRFQRGRSLSRAARLALAEGDKAKGDKLDADAIAELKLAAEGGYPIAFNNLGFAYRQGEGFDEDEDKAADLYLETFNRVVHCCWTPVARYLLEHEGEHDRSQVRRVVHDLTRWASALGSEPAGRLLRELYAGGTLTAPASPLAEEKATFASLPPWLGQPLDVRSTR